MAKKTRLIERRDLQYVPKETLTFAPDGIVYIMTEQDVPLELPFAMDPNSEYGNQKAGSSRINITNEITSISTNLSIDSVPGTANFTIATPRSQTSQFYRKFFRNGHLIIQPMYEVEVYLKGRFIVEGEKSPRYFPAFWGIVSEVNITYNDGRHYIDILCHDILRMLEMVRVNTQAGLKFPEIHGETDPQNFIHTLRNKNIYEIIEEMFEVSVEDLLSIGGLISSQYYAQTIDNIQWNNKKLASYWRERFKTLYRRLIMLDIYGSRIQKNAGTFIDDADNSDPRAYYAGKKTDALDSSQLSSFIKRNGFFNHELKFSKKIISETKPYNPVRGFSGSWQGESASRLALAREASSNIHYELYMDSTGDVFFKPPFYNMDVRGIKYYEIEDIDIISWTFSYSETRVVTWVNVYGNWSNLISNGVEEIKPYGMYVDYNLARQFGLRSQQVVVPWVRNSTDAFNIAVGELDYLNRDIFTASMQIIGRPELRIGFPIYIKSWDTFFYVKGISHNFAFGSNFTTTLALTAIRRPYYGSTGIAVKDSILKAGNGSVFFSEKERYRPRMANAILTRDPESFYEIGQEARKKKKDTETDSDNILNEKSKSLEWAKEGGGENIDKKSAVLNAHSNIRPVNIITPGYVTPSENNPSQGQTFSNTKVTVMKAPYIEGIGTLMQSTKTSFPLSDEAGYELYGGYPYARNIVVTPDLKIIYKDPKKTVAVDARNQLFEGIETALQHLFVGTPGIFSTGAKIANTSITQNIVKSFEEKLYYTLTSDRNPLTKEKTNKNKAKAVINNGLGTTVNQDKTVDSIPGGGTESTPAIKNELSVKSAGAKGRVLKNSEKDLDKKKEKLTISNKLIKKYDSEVEDICDILNKDTNIAGSEC